MPIFQGFYTPDDRARAQTHRAAEAEEARARAVALRRRNQQATAELNVLLPFAWQVGKVRACYQGPPVWERGPAALHIQLQQPVQLPGKGQPVRPAGDWLCQASLDTETGELRYEPEHERELWHSDGSGEPGTMYQPAPTCKNCLKKAQFFAR